MLIVITKEIKNALQKLIDECGSVIEVERKTGIRNQTIGKYRSGEIKKMNERTWAVLEPYLRQYLKPDVANIVNNAPTDRIYGRVGFIQSPTADTAATQRLAVLDEAIDAIMSAEIEPDAKIKLYSILKELKNKK